MSLFGMAWRALWTRPAITLLTLLGIALGSGLICAVLALGQGAQSSFKREAALVHLMAGPEGSRLQLVLSSLYHLDQPAGILPLEVVYPWMQDDLVAQAVQLGIGDSFRGRRIVGASTNLFFLTQRDHITPLFSFAEGRAFSGDFEAVLGSEAARATGLKIGDSFMGSHGLSEGGEVHGDFPYKVVGRLAPTGTAFDRAVYTSIESVWAVHGHDTHDHEHHDHGPGEVCLAGKEVSAVLFQMNAAGPPLFAFRERMEKEAGLVTAMPLEEMHRMFTRFLRPLQRVLLLLAGLVALVAGLNILNTLLQSAEQRRRDRAVLRLLGARPRDVVSLVFLEAVLLVFIGLALGWFLAHLGLAIAQPTLESRMGLHISAWAPVASEWKALGLIALGGAVCGLVPALMQYRRSPLRDVNPQA